MRPLHEYIYITGQSAPCWEKKRTNKVYAKKFGCTQFVESGTAYGDMVAAMLPYFQTLTSIELYLPLYTISSTRFLSEPKVTILYGDSSTELKKYPLMNLLYSTLMVTILVKEQPKELKKPQLLRNSPTFLPTILFPT